jgi:hypothetical protein
MKSIEETNAFLRNLLAHFEAIFSQVKRFPYEYHKSIKLNWIERQ